MTPEKRARWLIPSLAAVLYLAQGFPFGLVTLVVPIYMRKSGWTLTEIGLVQTIALAWAWKFFWSPVIDLFGSYRRWTAVMLAIITIAVGALAIVPPSSKPIVWILITVIAFASATQDIAIDALAIRITPEKLLGIINSIRVAAYRGALIIAGGGLMVVSDLAGWRGAFLTGAAITAIALAFTTLLPHESGESEHRESPFAGVYHWLARPQAALFLGIAFLYRMGDAALTPMAPLYWADRGYTPTEIGAFTTAVGMAFLIAGAIAGGVFVTRFGIYRGLLWLGIAQMASNAGYALVAMTGAGRTAIYTAAIIENFTGGLGTAAFLAFLMSVCDREHAATQYAMLSAVFALSRSLIGTASGWGVDHLGYTEYFWITVTLAIPGLVLVAMLRKVTLVAPPREELVDV